MLYALLPSSIRPSGLQGYIVHRRVVSPECLLRHSIYIPGSTFIANYYLSSYNIERNQTFPHIVWPFFCGIPNTDTRSKRHVVAEFLGREE